MIDLLHAFAVGIAFSVGVGTGALICSIATQRGRKEASDSFLALQKEMNITLSESLACHCRIAAVMEFWGDRQLLKDNEIGEGES